jgi:hypothetical protein
MAAWLILENKIISMDKIGQVQKGFDYRWPWIPKNGAREWRRATERKRKYAKSKRTLFLNCMEEKEESLSSLSLLQHRGSFASKTKSHW